MIMARGHIVCLISSPSEQKIQRKHPVNVTAQLLRQFKQNPTLLQNQVFVFSGAERHEKRVFKGLLLFSRSHYVCTVGVPPKDAVEKLHSAEIFVMNVSMGVLSSITLNVGLNSPR